MTNANSTVSESQPDYPAIKAKQQAVWAAGDYARVGVRLQIVGEQLCEAMDLRAGQSILDVAAGNGNATLAAARRFCQVVSTDYVEPLLERSRARAAADGFEIEFRKADAEDLPFADEAFDNVVSTFGVMFAPNQAQAASELIRVCKSGGKIGLANWTPSGFIGQLLKAIGKHVPPPAGVSSPAKWGTEAFLHDYFDASVGRIDVTSRQFNFRYRSAEHWLEVFGTYYGPTLKAFESLDATSGESLRADIRELIATLNLATDGTMVVPSEYLEVIVSR